MNEDMGKRIRRFRDAADLSQQDVADKIGMNRSTYSRREKNGNFDFATMVKLADIFGVHVDRILYEARNRAEQPPLQFNIEVDDFILSNNDKKDLKILQSLNPKQRKIASDFLSALQSGTISVED